MTEECKHHYMCIGEDFVNVYTQCNKCDFQKVFTVKEWEKYKLENPRPASEDELMAYIPDNIPQENVSAMLYQMAQLAIQLYLTNGIMVEEVDFHFSISPDKKVPVCIAQIAEMTL